MHSSKYNDFNNYPLAIKYHNLNMYMKTILFLLLLVLASSRLDVYMPTCATKKFESNINYTLANFGHILYGRTLVG